MPPSRANPHLYQSLGVMAAERGRVQEAREHFKEGTKTEAGAQSAALWQAWGMLESRQGNGDQARKLFQRGLQACPKNRYVWLSWVRPPVVSYAKAYETKSSGIYWAI